MNLKIFLYIIVMAVVTYFIRMIPFVLFKKKIKSTFAKSFLYYTPCTVLSAMTIPSIFYSTGDIVTAACGFTVAVIVALKTKSLLIVASAASAAALVAGFVYPLIYNLYI